MNFRNMKSEKFSLIISSHANIPQTNRFNKFDFIKNAEKNLMLQYCCKLNKGHEIKIVTPWYYWYARQDSNPPKADFGWHLNLRPTDSKSKTN